MTEPYDELSAFLWSRAHVASRGGKLSLDDGTFQESVVANINSDYGGLARLCNGSLIHILVVSLRRGG